MDIGTLVRTIALLLSFVNMYLAQKGLSPIPVGEEEISFIITVGISIWAWWKNNNITPEAKKAQAVLEKTKADKKFYKQTGTTIEDEFTGGNL